MLSIIPRVLPRLTPLPSRLPLLSLQARSFLTTPLLRNEIPEPNTRPEIDTPTSLDTFTEEEEMLRETVRKFATEVIGPKSFQMDEDEVMDPVSCRFNYTSHETITECVCWRYLATL
jgi:hypothetical protein